MFGWCERGIKIFLDDGFILTREFSHYCLCTTTILGLDILNTSICPKFIR